MQNHKITRNAVRTCLVVTLCFSFIGCGGSKRNISNDPTYKTGYATNQVYRIKVPLFVERVSVGSGKSEMVVGKAGRIQNGPGTIEEYNRGDKRKWPRVVGVLEPETKIRITKLEYAYHLEMGDMFYIYAQVLDGSLVDKIVDVFLISKNVEQTAPHAWVPTIDPEYLELVR